MYATLTIRVKYDEAEQPAMPAAEAQLRRAAQHLADNGLLSGEEPSLLVEDWSASVSIG